LILEERMASLFKRAAIRGVAHELVNRGHCCFPTKEALDEAADAVADGPIMSGAPEVSGPDGHSPEELAAAAQKLIEIAEALMAEAHGTGAGAEAPAAPGPEAAAVKAACSRDLSTVASEVAVACMDKAAAETAHDPKLVGVAPNDKNDLAAATRHDSTAKLDAHHRPEGKYLVPRGQSDLDSSKGEVGHIGRPTSEPSKRPSGTNSLSEDAKKAALREAVVKHANKLVGLHEPQKNDLAHSPDPLAHLDAKHRPEGKYQVAPGGANFREPQAARVGIETKPDVKPSQSPAGSNSVVESSKAAADESYLESFKKCAEDVGRYLPQELSEDEKVAAINEMIPLDHDGRQVKLNALHEKAAAECKECTPEKKCDKHGGQKKESALLARVREIANKASAPAA
jgi:hypothetical protein